MATWIILQLLLIILAAVLLITQVLYALLKGWPLFWLFRKEAYANHLAKAKKELEKAEEQTKTMKEEAEKAYEEAEEAEKKLKNFKTKRAPKSRRKK